MAAGRFRQPANPHLVRIDWNNPLTRGLVIALLPDTTGRMVNIANPSIQFTQGGLAATMGAGRYGRHFAKATANASTIYNANRTGSLSPGNSGIVLLHGITASGNGNGLVGFNASNAGFYIGSGGQLGLTIASSVVATGTTTIVGPAVLGWSALTGNYKLYLNGVDDTNTSSGSTFGISGLIDRVGIFSGGTHQGTSSQALILQWSRQLSPAEHKALARNPWQVFTRTARDVLVAAGGVTNNPLTAPLGTLTLTGLVPTITQGNSTTAPLGTLTLTGLVPTLTQGHSVTAPLGTATLTGLVPTFSQPVALTAVLGTVTLTGLVPTLTQGNSQTAPLGTATLTGLVPTFSQSSGNELTAVLGTITLTGLVPTLTQGNSVTVPLGTATLTGLVPTFSNGASASVAVTGGGTRGYTRRHFVEIKGKLHWVDTQQEAIELLRLAALADVPAKVIQQPKKKAALKAPQADVEMFQAEMQQQIQQEADEREQSRLLDEDDDDVMWLLL
jgi:hypothetical protein